MSLQNSKIRDLPGNVSVPAVGWFALDNVDTGICEKISSDQVLTSRPSQNFEWVSDNGTGYSINEFVTSGGFGWKSLVNLNLNNVPGVDPTKWQKIGINYSGFRFWAAGAYIDAEVLVLREVGERVYIFRLDPDEPRPFISSDFEDELNVGTWKITSQIQLISVSTAGGTITLDMLGLTELMFKGSAAIAAPKTWDVDNETNALIIKSFKFELSGLHAQTMPANFRMETWRPEWDTVTKIWTPSFIGNYEAELTYEPVSNIWNVKMFGPF